MITHNDDSAIANSAENSGGDNNLDNSFDNFLQAQLQQQKPYLPDDNFSVRVMASLPAVKAGIGWRERLIIAVPLLIISVLVLSQNLLLAFAIKSWVLLSVISVESMLKILLAFSLAALFGVSCWLARQRRWL